MTSIIEPQKVTHINPVRNLAFTPDSRQILSGDDGGLLVMSTVPDGSRVAAWRCHETSISGLAVLPGLNLVVTAAVDGSVRAWRLNIDDPGPLELISQASFTGEVSGVSFRPDHSGVLAISVQSGEVALWRPLSAGSPNVIHRVPAQANSTSWTHDGRRLAVGCDDCHVYQFELVSGVTTVFRGHSHHADQLGYSHCGRYLASGSHDRTVRVWDADTGDCLAVLPHTLDTVKPDWAQDGRLATCSYDQRVRIWDPLKAELIAEIHEHRYDVDDVAWSPDNRWIASCAWDQTVRLYDAAHYNQVAVIGGDRNQVYALSVDSKRRRFFAGTTGGNVYEVSLDGQQYAILLSDPHDGAVTSADLSPNGKVLATTGTDSQLVLRSVAECPTQAMFLKSHHGLDLDIARFSARGDRLAVGDRADCVTMYQVDGLVVRPLFDIPHERRVKALAWSAGNGMLVSAADGNVRVINPDDGRVISQWRAHERMINAVSLSPDGSLVATACWDRLVRIFRAGGHLMHELRGHRYNVNSVEFAPAPLEMIATGSWDGDVGIWDTTTGHLLKLASPKGRSPVQAVRWISGGDALLAATWAGEVLLIQAPDWEVSSSWKLGSSPMDAS